MNILITGVRDFVSFNFEKVLVSENTIYGLDIIIPKKEGAAKTFS